MFHWLLTWTGGTNASGAIYLEWSGFISDLAFISAGIAFYKHHKCVTCWRIAHHPVEGTPYKTCHKHATTDMHDRLKRSHAKNYPEQSKLLRRR